MSAHVYFEQEQESNTVAFNQAKVRAGAAAIVSLVMCASCAYIAQPKKQIPVQIVAGNAPGQHTRMVVVLPGVGDTLSRMRHSGIVEAVQKNMPDADVALVELTLPYYIKTPAANRLHDEIVKAARERGYEEIYLAGASMGGMGALMYENQHPKEIDGLILMAPFMGNAALLAEINAAGGLAKWEPGPAPAVLNANTGPRENWRVVRSWAVDPGRAQHVWLICGQADRFHPAAELIASQLPKQNFITLEGGHGWKVWSEGASEAFAAIGKAPKPELAKK